MADGARDTASQSAQIAASMNNVVDQAQALHRIVVES
jgi:hypothetical protein